MAANTWEIPKEQWGEYLARIFGFARGKLVKAELIDSQRGDQVLAEHAQLRSLVAGPPGGLPVSIDVELGLEGESERRHLLPAHLFAMYGASGELQYLSIEDDRHAQLLLRFAEPPLLPSGAWAVPAEPREILVSDYMTSAPFTVASGSSVAGAFKVLQDRGVRHLPVVDERGALVGVVSERELCVVKVERGVPPEDVSVDELMVRSPYTISPAARLDEAAAVMATRKYGSAVAIDKGRVVGILTTTDVLRALVNLRARQRGQWLA